MLPLFHPNKSQSGTLIDFSIQSSRKEKGKSGFYLKITKQSGPLSKPFAGSKEICVIKFNELELASMLNAMEKKNSWTTVHKTTTSNRSITFNPIYKKNEAGEVTTTVNGYGFNTSANNIKFGFMINLNECILMRELFKWSIQRLIEGRYAEEKARIKDSIKSKITPIEDEVAAIVEELDQAELED